MPQEALGTALQLALCAAMTCAARAIQAELGLVAQQQQPPQQQQQQGTAADGAPPPVPAAMPLVSLYGSQVRQDAGLVLGHDLLMLQSH